MTELLGFRARRATSTKCSGSRPPATIDSRALFREIVSDAARLDPSYLRRQPLSGGRIQREILRALGLADGAKIPAALAPVDRARIAASRRRHGIGAGRRRRESVPGGRLVLQRAAGRVRWNAAGAGRTCSCSRRRAMRARRWARCITSGISVDGKRAAPGRRRIAAAGPQLWRRGDQAGARKLQAALPVSALDR